MRAKVNFQYPRIGAVVRINPHGHNPARTGVFAGIDDTGKLILDMDPQNLLPDNLNQAGRNYKFELISVNDDFEVL